MTKQARIKKTAALATMTLAELLTAANATLTPAAKPGEYTLVVDGVDWGSDWGIEDETAEIAVRDHLTPKVSTGVSKAQQKARRAYVCRYAKSFA